MTVMITCILMLISVTIRVHKADQMETISPDEIVFIIMATAATLVPGLNLLTSICYLYRVIKM